MTEPNRQSGENEERIIEIEIERLRPFKEHPFQVKDISTFPSKISWNILELCAEIKPLNPSRELDDETGIGLIEKRRQGFGKVKVIYVNNLYA